MHAVSCISCQLHSHRERHFELSCLRLQKYGCNILNLGNSRIISVHPETARQIVRCPEFTGDVQTIAFDAITSMYGACHCSSAVVRRIPKRYENTDVGRNMPMSMQAPENNDSTHTTASSNGDGQVATHMANRTSPSPFLSIPGWAGRVGWKRFQSPSKISCNMWQSVNVLTNVLMTSMLSHQASNALEIMRLRPGTFSCKVKHAKYENYESHNPQ